jgi:hypothetical protein
MPVIVAEHLYADWLANERIDAGKALTQALSHPDRSLVAEPVELERKSPAPKPMQQPDQLALF